jgi:hypothetical protein
LKSDDFKKIWKNKPQGAAVIWKNKKKEFEKQIIQKRHLLEEKLDCFFQKHKAKMIQRFRASFNIKSGQILFCILKGQFPGNGTETYSSCILTSQIFSV